MRALRKFFLPFLICIVFLFTACVSLGRTAISAEDEAVLYPVEMYVPETFDWQEIVVEAGEGTGSDQGAVAGSCVIPGVWRFDFENPDIPLVYHAVKIELGAASGNGHDELQAVGARLTLAASQWERTADFAARENCLVAMNATPFDKTKLAGIYKLGGDVLSEPVARYAALGLRYGGGGEGGKAEAGGEDGDAGAGRKVLEARIFESQTDPALGDFDAVFGGFFVVLEKSQVRTDYVRRHTSRSGAGLSADGKTLYLLVVEGERPQKSIGLSYPQCGEIFRAMGCSDALEFDGGGSSDLCINGRSVLTYRVHRRQGNSIGFTLVNGLPRRPSGSSQ